MKLGRCCACLAVVLSAVGCASINSKTHEERVAAVAALTTQEELFAAAMDADYEDVQIAAVRRISDQRALTAVVATPRFGEEVKSIALSSITNEVYLADVVVADDSSEKHAGGFLDVSVADKRAYPVDRERSRRAGVLLVHVIENRDF